MNANVEFKTVSNVLEVCNRLNSVKNGSSTMVLVTGRLYEEMKKAGSRPDESYKKSDGQVSPRPIKSFRLYDLYTVYTVQVELTAPTAWVSIVQLDYKEFSGKLEENLLIFDLK